MLSLVPSMVPQVTAPWPRPGPGVSGDGELRSRSDLTFILLGMARLVWALQSPLYWRGPCYQEAACYHLRRHDNSYQSRAVTSPPPQPEKITWCRDAERILYLRSSLSTVDSVLSQCTNHGIRTFHELIRESFESSCMCVMILAATIRFQNV